MLAPRVEKQAFFQVHLVLGRGGTLALSLAPYIVYRNELGSWGLTWEPGIVSTPCHLQTVWNTVSSQFGDQWVQLQSNVGNLEAKNLELIHKNNYCTPQSKQFSKRNCVSTL